MVAKKYYLCHILEPFNGLFSLPNGLTRPTFVKFTWKNNFKITIHMGFDFKNCYTKYYQVFTIKPIFPVQPFGSYAPCNIVACKFATFWRPHSIGIPSPKIIVFDIFAGVALFQERKIGTRAVFGAVSTVIYCRRHLAFINYAFVWTFWLCGLHSASIIHAHLTLRLLPFVTKNVTKTFANSK